MYLMEHVFECSVISRGPQKRLCWRRAAASPGTARRARLRSRRSRGPWAHNLWRRRTRQWSPCSRCKNCASLPQTSGCRGRGKGAEGRARRSRKGETHVDGHGDGMKDSNLKQGACVRENEDTTTLPEKMRTTLNVVASVRIVRCHANIDGVIDVRVMKCHANIHVVIGIRVVLCHPLVDIPIFWIFLLRAQILILFPCCNNSS